MEYEEILDKIRKCEKNMEIARSRNDMKRVKKYMNVLSSLRKLKINKEREAPKDVLARLETRLKALEKENYELSMKIRKLQDVIDEKNLTIEKMKTAGDEPTKEEEKPKRDTRHHCPYCEKSYVRKQTLIKHVLDVHKKDTTELEM